LDLPPRKADQRREKEIESSARRSHPALNVDAVTLNIRIGDAIVQARFSPPNKKTPAQTGVSFRIPDVYQIKALLFFGVTPRTHRRACCAKFLPDRHMDLIQDREILFEEFLSVLAPLPQSFRFLAEP
jgi:hypothetical protein